MLSHYEKTIGFILKECRLQKNLSVNDVACKLLESYHIRISKKSIYGWEGNHSLPTPTTFLAICEIYEIHHLRINRHTHFLQLPQKTQHHNPDSLPNSTASRLTPLSGNLRLTKEEARLILLCRKYPQFQEEAAKYLGI